MTRSDYDQRNDRLRQARAQGTFEALAASHRAITLIQARGTAVTFAAVARQAEVSVSYLHKNHKLSDRIRSLEGAGTRTQDSLAKATSDNAVRGLRNKVQLLSERLRRIEADNTRLRAENAALRGEVAQARREARPMRQATVEGS